jgi:TolA-binding protein
VKRACPSVLELERAYFSADAGVAEHVKGCAACGAEWARIASLAELAREIEAPPAEQERRERIRTMLVTRAAPERSRVRWPWAADRSRERWPWAVAIAAVVVVAGLMIDRGATVVDPVSELPVIQRGRIHALDDARFWTARAQPDEIVRLVGGSISIDVDALEPNERFRVVTGDGEVEVRGTTFDVTAAEDRLREVRVLRGTVEVRWEGDASILHDGERWHAPEPADDRASAQAKDVAPRARSQRSVHVDPSVRGPAERKVHVDPSLQPADRLAYEAGWSSLRAGEFGRAADSFARALDLTRDPSLREDAQYFLAVSLARAGDEPRAIAPFEAYRLDPGPTARAGDASAMLGWLQYDRGHPELAKPLFDRAIASGSRRAVDSGRSGLEAIRRALRDRTQSPPKDEPTPSPRSP